MLVRLAWRNLWRNRWRTSIIIGAMVFGLMGVSAMMGFMSGFLDSMVNNAIQWQTSHVQIHNERYILNADIQERVLNSKNILVELEQSEEVKAVSARFLVDGMIASARSNRGIRINGINIEQEAALTPIESSIQQGEWLDQSGRNPILVSEKTAQRLKLRVGSKVVLTFTDLEGQVAGAAYRVRGIFQTPSTSFDDSNVYVRKADIQKTAKADGVHEIAMLLKDPNQVSSFQLHLEETINNNIISKNNNINVSRTWKTIQPLLSTMTESIGVMNQVVLVIFVVAMMFGIINIMLMSVYERTREFGVLMAVGMEKQKVFTLVMLETTFLGLTGASLGIAASIGMIALMNVSGISLGAMAEGLGAYGIDTVLYPRVSLGEYQMIFATVCVASVLAAVYPARQILKQRPVDAMAEKN